LASNWDERILQSDCEGALLLMGRATTEEAKTYASKRIAETRKALEDYQEKHKSLPVSWTAYQGNSEDNDHSYEGRSYIGVDPRGLPD